MVLFPAFYVVEKPGKIPVTNSPSAVRTADIQPVRLDENDGARIPGHCLTVAKPVRAFHLRLVEIGTALPDGLMVQQEVYGAFEECRMIEVESGTR